MSVEVKAQDELALASVKSIYDAASESQTLLAQMEQAAEDAGTTLNGIYADAKQAEASAESASEYAARALGNLSTVQSITETLNWITSHGTMTLTGDYKSSTDTEVDEDKKYYTRTGSGTEAAPYVYTEVSNPTGNPSTQGYYEGSLDPTHVYFIRDNNGDYEVGNYHYSIVAEPDVADISTYYELSIDESLNNYIGTHLALTSEGLWLIPESNGTPTTDGKKILIATGSGSTYTTAGIYIIDRSNGTDTVVASFLASGVTIGNSTASSNEGNVYVDNDSVEIRRGATVLSSFDATGASLGKNALSARVKFCDEAAYIEGNIVSVDSSVYERHATLKTEGETTASRTTFAYSGIEATQHDISGTDYVGRIDVVGDAIDMSVTALCEDEEEDAGTESLYALEMSDDGLTYRFVNYSRDQGALQFVYNPIGDGGTPIMFVGMGADGVNHGVYSKILDNWLVHSDGDNAYFDGGQIASGHVNITPSAKNTPTSATISFGKTFETPPSVVVTPTSSVPGTVVTGWGVTDVTTTGCKIWVTRTNTTATGLNWIATSI